MLFLFALKFLSKTFVDVQYNTVKPNLKGSAVLLQFRDSFGFKKAKITKRKNFGLDIS